MAEPPQTKLGNAIMKKPIATSFAAFVLTGSLAFATTSWADEKQTVMTYSAADFESVETVKDLYQRVRKIARRHCPSYSRTRNLQGTNACVDEVVDELISRVDHPALTAYRGGEEQVRIALETIGHSNQG